ncbi:hypothetical protein ACQP3C_27710, partial [Escherichia coli]
HFHQTLISWHKASVVLTMVALGIITSKNYASCSTFALCQAVHSILQMIYATQSSSILQNSNFYSNFNDKTEL